MSIQGHKDFKYETARLKYTKRHIEYIIKKITRYKGNYSSNGYLEHLIFGAGEKPVIQHVVIDEAQDYSLFQFYILRHVLNTRLFTILGDLSQGIHAYRAIENWQQVMETVFDKDDCQFLTLEQSYRTTVEIMSLANEVIKSLGDQGLTLAKPVIRHGAKPQVLRAKRESEMITMIKDVVEQRENGSYKSFAIVCKSHTECERIHRKLRKAGVEATLITGEEGAYAAGAVILPSYITKGLEFDVVLIINIKDRYMTDDIDTKLLYVAMTRSLHKLYVGYTNGTIPLLDKADRSLFEEYLKV